MDLPGGLWASCISTAQWSPRGRSTLFRGLEHADPLATSARGPLYPASGGRIVSRGWKPRGLTLGPLWASVGVLVTASWGGSRRQGQSDRNLALLGSPTSPQLSSRWGLPAPGTGSPLGSCGLNFNLWWVRRRGPDTLHFPISGNKSCGALYCQVEKSPLQNCVGRNHPGA